MALTLLPEEVLEQIIKYFSVRDLLACSAVSLAWREKFNVDIFWRKFCLKEVKDFLEDVKCAVEPSFVLPEHDNERLQPLCNWRIHYMRKTHLINNWRSETFSLSEVTNYNIGVLIEVKIDCEGVHWLFLTARSEIEIWNINIIPQLYATIPIFHNCPNVGVFIAGKRAIVTQWNVVTVYNLNSHQNSSKTLFRFVLEENKILPSLFWNTTNKNDIESINEDDDFRFADFEHLLVGYKRIPNPITDLSMYIWDISSGEHIIVESMLNLLCEASEIAFTNIYKIDDSRGLIRLVFRSPKWVHLCSQLYVYDFKKQKFTNTNIMFEGVAVWCGYAHNIIVTFSSHPGGIIKFHDYTTEKLLSSMEIGEYTNSDQIQLVDSYLLYCMFNCVNVLDIHKQEVIYCLQFSFYSFVRRLTVVEPRFVVVWLLERGGSPGCPSYHQEVWDMKDLSNKLFQFSSEDGFQMLTNSPSIVKQVISYNNMINVYTFW